ncbi:MAG: endolytic transglycosylase MltG [Symbiobacteriaceae bacterium]|nr:endolytic transglycosylase MltG [Symbiobacteriaceae bacterium]
MIFSLKKFSLLLMLVVFILTGCDISGSQREQAIYDDSRLSDDIVEVQIEPGMSVNQIGALLVSEGVILDADLFRYYNSKSGLGSSLQAGLYRFNIGMSIAEVTEKMAAGDIYIPSFVFSIPEGSNIRQIARAAERQGFCSEEEFLAAVEHSNLRHTDPGVIFALEGYLFPATYTWSYILSPEELLQAFYQEALDRFGDLDIPVDHPLSFAEIIVLASILEKESQYDNEREIVAGVFLNRLAIGMPLQSCATVNYVLPEFKEILTYEDIAIDSPYNTYVYDGLPIGPISCPGELALQAVLYPAETDYLFFVVGEDGTHIFSHTYEEHEAAAAWLGG